MTTTETAAATATHDAHRIKCYEAMFLLNQAEAADLGGVIDHLNTIFAKHNIELIAMKKWDERRLAYEIEKQKRGVFLLAYVRCHTSALSKLERETNLSERIMRVLVTKADHLSIEEMQSADAREDLATEARLRAEKAAAGEEEQGRRTVTLGAPTKEQLGVTEAAKGQAPSESEPKSGEDAEGESETHGDAETPEDA